MPGEKAFLDSNVLIYAYSVDEPEKRVIAVSLCRSNPIISFQVLNEFSNVLLRKFCLNPTDVSAKLDELSGFMDIKIIDMLTIKKALQLKDIYEYSYFDCIMLASALNSGCPVIYTEDLQHGQIIENRLKIIDQFLKKQRQASAHAKK